MEKKNNNLVIMLMVVIIVILAVLCILFANGKITINFGSNYSNKLEENNENTTTNNNENNVTVNENKIYSANEYITLEDVQINGKITIKKVKINHLSDELTRDFYNQQNKLIEEAKRLGTNGEEGNFSAKYDLYYNINNNILSIVYSIIITDAVGSGCTSKAVTNIDLLNNKIISEEELLAKANTSYEKIVNEYYNQELENWKKLNEYNEKVIDYYDLTFDDFKNNKDKQIANGMKKIADIMYTYIKNNKIVYEYYAINKDSIFHPVGKGGWFNWETVELGDYK